MVYSEEFAFTNKEHPNYWKHGSKIKNKNVQLILTILFINLQKLLGRCLTNKSWLTSTNIPRYKQVHLSFRNAQDK